MRKCAAIHWRRFRKRRQFCSKRTARFYWDFIRWQISGSIIMDGVERICRHFFKLWDQRYGGDRRIYDLILGAPGNYLKYYIGYVEFLELKKIWIKEMGADSPQKAFHEAVLKVGPAPFDWWKNICGRWEKKHHELPLGGNDRSGNFVRSVRRQDAGDHKCGAGVCKRCGDALHHDDGVMSFWTGLMEIATRAGIIEMASKKMRPLIRFLFPQIPPGHKANAPICMNFMYSYVRLASTMYTTYV